MILTSFRTKAKTYVSATSVVAMVALSACDEAITLGPGAVDPTDTCGRFQESIAEARQEANQLRVQNIVAGAAVGALLGAALAGDGNREQGAIIGAVLGGATAGAATTNQQQQEREADAKVLRDVNAKAGSANQLLTKAGRASASLRTCRQAQVRDLESKVRAGSIGQSDARAQLRVLERRTNVDNRIISASFNGIGNRVDNFVRTGSQVSGVEQAIINRQAAARTAEQRSVRNATPNVSRAKNTQARLVNADARSRQSIERSLGAIDVLLSG